MDYHDDELYRAGLDNYFRWQDERKRIAEEYHAERQRADAELRARQTHERELLQDQIRAERARQKEEYARWRISRRFGLYDD